MKKEKSNKKEEKHTKKEKSNKKEEKHTKKDNESKKKEDNPKANKDFDINKFDELVKRNKASGKPWYYGLEGKWWWGMTENDARKHIESERVLKNHLKIVSPIIQDQEQTPQNVEISKEETPQNVELSKEETPQNVEINKEETPQNVEISKEETPQNVEITDINKEHISIKSNNKEQIR